MKRLLVIIALVCLAATSQAWAQTTSYTISPLEHQLTAQPRDTTLTVISLQNKTNKPVDVTVTAIDFEADPALDGQPKFLAEGNPKYGIANWFADANVSKTLTIPANQVVNYQAGFRVPFNATDQTYYGAVRFASADGQTVQEALIFITVGAPKTSLAIGDIVFSESNNATQSFGVFTVTMENIGQGLSTPKVTLRITAANGQQIAILEQIETGTVLPASKRKYTFAPASSLPKEQITATVSAVDQNGKTADKSIQLDRSVPAAMEPADTDEEFKKAPWFAAMVATFALLTGIAAVQLYRHRKMLLLIQQKKHRNL
jgi:hypothetical protein